MRIHHVVEPTMKRNICGQNSKNWYEANAIMWQLVKVKVNIRVGQSGRKVCRMKFRELVKGKGKKKVGNEWISVMMDRKLRGKKNWSTEVTDLWK